MVLKFYGDKRSPNTRRVLMILHEKNVPFEFVEVNVTKGQAKSPDNLKRQPFGLLPNIVSCASPTSKITLIIDTDTDRMTTD
jgi:glutathione S-transferase